MINTRQVEIQKKVRNNLLQKAAAFSDNSLCKTCLMVAKAINGNCWTCYKKERLLSAIIHK